MTDEEKQELLRQLRANQNPYTSLVNRDMGISSSPVDFGLSDQDKQAVGDYATNGIDYDKQARTAALNKIATSGNPYLDLMNGTFRDTGRVAAHPGEYLDSVIGAPVRSSIAQMQKGDFDIDPIGQMGKDPRNAPTNVDLAQNMRIQNPYLGAAVATGLDLTAQLPIGEIASAGKALPGIVGAVEDVSKLKGLGRASKEGEALAPLSHETVPGKFSLEDPDTKLMTSRELRKNKIERPMEHLSQDDMPINKHGEEDPENPWEEADYNYRLNGVPDTRFLVKDGEVIGHVGLDDDNKIKAAYINPEYQGQGYGKDMYRHLFNDGLEVKSDDLNAMEPGAKGIWDSLRKEMPDNIKKTKKGYSFTPPEESEVQQAPAGRFSSLKKMVKGEEQSSHPNPALNDDNYLYHITPKENAEAIMSEGIKPGVGKRTLAGHSEVGDDTPHGAFFSEKPLLGKDPKANGDYSVFRVPKDDDRLYHYDGYGATHLKSGRYYENEDLNGLLPIGVEEGDHFSLEPIEAEHVPQTVQQNQQAPAGRFGSLKKMVGAEPSSSQALIDSIKTPEEAAALSPEARQKYLEALDEAHGPRDKRAANMGFDPETYYHGTANADIHEFQPATTHMVVNDGKPGSYFTPNPETAGKEAWSKADSARDKLWSQKLDELEKQGIDDKTADQIANKILEQPTSGESVYPVKIRPDLAQRFSDWGVPSKSVKVENPGVRSVNAAFDPRFKDSNHLLAGKLGGGDLEDAAKVSRFQKVKDLLGMVDTPEKAAALSPEARQQYLEALDEVHGPQDKRAQDLGFDPQTFYHGTPNQTAINEFNPPKARSGQLFGSGNYVTRDPETASLYADILDDHNGVPNEEESGIVYPLRARVGKTFDATGNPINKMTSPEQFSSGLQKAGYNSVKAGADEYNILNSKDLRSVNAAFDPRFADSTHLLAGKLGSDDLEGAAKVTRFSKLKDLLNQVDTPEKAAALSPEARQQYLEALDEQYGPRDQRAKDMGFGDKSYYHGTNVPLDSFSKDHLGANTDAQSAKKAFFFTDNPTIASDYGDAAVRMGSNNPEMIKARQQMSAAENIKKAMIEKYGGFDNIPSNELSEYQKLSDDGYKTWSKAKNNERAWERTHQAPYVYENRLKMASPLEKDFEGKPGRPVSFEQLLTDAKNNNNDSTLFKNAYDAPGSDVLDLPKRPPSNIATVFEPNQIRDVNAAFDPRFKDSTHLLAGQLGPSNLNGANLAAALSPDLQKIAQIESSGGKNKNHETTQTGLNAGDTAGGATGLMPIMVKEILKKNPDLANKYPELASAAPDDITSILNNDPQMEAEVANAHWNRLNQVFGGDKARMAYAWRNGITGAKQASDVQVQEHPYVQKFLNGEPARFSRLKSILGN